MDRNTRVRADQVVARGFACQSTTRCCKGTWRRSSASDHTRLTFGSSEWSRAAATLSQKYSNAFAPGSVRTATKSSTSPRIFGTSRESRWSGAKARIQPTLGKMIRIALAANGHEATPAAVREYQTKQFARTGGESVDCRTVPSPQPLDTFIGFTPSCGRCLDLATRDSYRWRSGTSACHCSGSASTGIDPSAVILFGGLIATSGAAFLDGMDRVERTSSRNTSRQRGDTMCIVCRHPTSFGAKNAYFRSDQPVVRLRLGKAVETRSGTS